MRRLQLSMPMSSLSLSNFTVVGSQLAYEPQCYTNANFDAVSGVERVPLSDMKPHLITLRGNGGLL